MNRPIHSQCIVLGEGSLPVTCVELLQSKGFEVTAFISRDAGIKKDIQKLNIPFYTQILAADSLPRVDYLFSINNGFILEKAVIEKATKLAINYHDSPLPRYAGVYATNWAVLNHETKHAVSWHVLEEGIDTGDILMQAPIDIESNEAVWSVNMKCFEAAIHSFKQLIQQLIDNTLVRTAQTSDRLYKGFMKRPYHLGFVTPNLSISDLKRLQLSTDFGSLNDNEFLLPHLLLGKTCYTLVDFDLYEDAVDKPGIIGRLEGRSCFACADGWLVPTQLFDQNNKPISFETLLDRHSLAEGAQMPQAENSEMVAEIFQKLCKKELYWKQEIERSELLPFPFIRKKSLPSKPYCDTFDFTLPESLCQHFESVDKPLLSEAILLAYCMRLSNQQNGCLGYVPSSLKAALQGYDSVFQPVLPCNIECETGKSAKGIIDSILEHLRNLSKGDTFTRDILLRYQHLKPFIEQTYGYIVCPDLPVCTSDMDETFYLSVKHNRLSMALPDFTLKKRAQWWVEGLQHFVQAMDANVHHFFSEIPVKEMEKNIQKCEQLVHVWSQFQSMAKRYPNQKAIVDGTRIFTYDQFLTDIQHTAHFLGNLGLEKNVSISICLPRSYEFFVSQWAILASGHAFVPIDASTPNERKAFIFHDSASALVLTNIQLSDAFPKEKCLFFDQIQTKSQPVLSFDGDLSDLAYIIYTSGSTGIPKGVLIDHLALSTFVFAASKKYGITQTDRILQFSNLGFDASIEEVFCTLSQGATLYLRNDDLLDPAQTFHFSKQHQITVWDFPTAFWRQLMLASQDWDFPSHIRAIIIGGEAMTNADFDMWKKHQASSSRLFNTYGPTETTVVATVFEVTPTYTLTNGVPIGQPLEGYDTAVLDAHQMVVPKGMTGELYIAGNGLAKGYLNRPENEAKSFVWIENKLGKTRFYATGDLVYCDQDEQLQYVGRSDNQLKIRGYRVEPGEIENRLIQLGDLKHCVVLGRANQRGEKSLVAFFIPKTPDVKAADVLKADLKKHVPDYMVPDLFIELTELPMTPNGKIDHKKLLEIAQSRPIQKVEKAHQEPISPTVEKLVDLFQSILDQDQLGPDDDFFELGGHSLRAVSLMTQIQQQLGIQLPLSSLISCPTPRLLGACIEGEQTDQFWQCMVPIRPEGDKMPLYLIHGAGLNVLLYQSLGNHLDHQRPIFAMQAKGLDGKTELSTSIEEMAADYVAEIRKNQPNGPYALFGFSLGGFIAFEMARQLLDQNQKIAFLGVIDTVTSYAKEDLSLPKKLKAVLKTMIAKPAFLIYAFYKEPNAEKKKFVKQKLRNFKFTLLYYFSRVGLYRLKQASETASDGTPVYLSSKAAVVIDTALNRYKLKPAPVVVDLFKADKQQFYIHDPKTYGWDKYATKGVVVKAVPGAHSDLFAPPNDVHFAKLLNDRLDEIEGH